MYTHRCKSGILAHLDGVQPRKKAKKVHRPKKNKSHQTDKKKDTIVDLQLNHNSSLHTSAHVDVVEQKKNEISKLLGSPCLSTSTTDSHTKTLNHHMSDIAQMFMRKPHDTLTTNAAYAQFTQPDDITILDRKWEEKFLHEPTGCERPCANAASGTCFASMLKTGQINDRMLTLCEFYVPMEYEKIRVSGWIWPKEIKPCLLCLRAEIYSRFLETRCNANGCLQHVNYANVGNIIGELGEYTADSCFVSRPDLYEGVLHPVVIPTIHDYTVFVRNGNRHLKQLHAYPDDTGPSFFFEGKT